MDATEERIEQFRQMAKANPEDDLAHFAFANALMNAGRVAEAAPVLRHVVRINSGYSRAYLLLGEALEANGDDEGAIEAWQRGRLIAMRRGELMAGNEMKTRLEERDAPLSSEEAELLLIDDPAPPEEERPLLAGEVRCLRSGRIGAAMLDNPFDDELGAFIQKKISQESWEGWIEMSIKVINELRLDLGDPEGQQSYEEHMRDYLNLPDQFFSWAKTSSGGAPQISDPLSSVPSSGETEA